MRRLQIMIEDDAYEISRCPGSHKGQVSKASLIRRYVRLGLQPLPPITEDPLASLAASAGFEPADIDETVYDR